MLKFVDEAFVIQTNYYVVETSNFFHIFSSTMVLDEGLQYNNI